MGLNRSGEVRKSRRKLRGDFAQMLFGSRWITVYVMSLLVGLVYLWDALLRVFPEAGWISSAGWLFPFFFGYFSTVWLKAGDRSLRGCSALGEGCFSVSRRNWLYASSIFFVLRAIPYLFYPQDPRRLPVWALVCVTGILLLPYVVVEQQTPAEAWRSARRSLERRPLLVVMTLLIGAAISVGVAQLTAMGYEQMVQLLTMAALQPNGGWVEEVLRWHVTGVMASLCQMILTILFWMVPGPTALWISWKTRR